MKRFLLTLAFVALCLCKAAVADEPYFPPGVWGKPEGAWKEEERQAFYEKWFGGQLAAMKEASLPEERAQAGANMVLRLLFLPSFDHGGMVRVAFMPDGQVRYEFKRLSGAGGYDPGRVNRRKEGQLDEETEQVLRALVGKIAPFTGKTPATYFNPNYVCMDGTQIVFEFASAEAYQAITRHECNLGRADPMRALTHLLDNISGNRLISEYTFIDPA